MPNARIDRVRGASSPLACAAAHAIPGAGLAPREACAAEIGAGMQEAAGVGLDWTAEDVRIARIHVLQVSGARDERVDASLPEMTLARSVASDNFVASATWLPLASGGRTIPNLH